MNTENISLYYRDPYSDKEYHLSLEGPSQNGTFYGWSVKAKHGPRGGTLTHVDRTRGVATTYTKAKNLYDRIVKEKTAKGYKKPPNGLNWHEVADITTAIETDGFDFAFTNRSRWDGIFNKDFHKLRIEYLEARNKLAKFIGMNEEVSKLV